MQHIHKEKKDALTAELHKYIFYSIYTYNIIIFWSTCRFQNLPVLLNLQSWVS